MDMSLTSLNPPSRSREEGKEWKKEKKGNDETRRKWPGRGHVGSVEEEGTPKRKKGQGPSHLFGKGRPGLDFAKGEKMGGERGKKRGGEPY